MAEAAPDNTETVGTGRVDIGVLGRLAAVQTDLRFHLGRDQGSSFCKKRGSEAGKLAVKGCPQVNGWGPLGAQVGGRGPCHSASTQLSCGAHPSSQDPGLWVSR